jgi:MtfA peptidase
MVWKLIKNWRRNRILRNPFPQTWEEILSQNVRLARNLSEDQHQRLKQLTQIFIAEKNWEGCGGLELDDEIIVTIASQACLMIVEQEEDCYSKVETILVYPNAYVANGATDSAGAAVIMGNSPREGEAWYRGPVILSWSDARAGARGEVPGKNLIIHEFAHQLDMRNGNYFDGIPPIESADQAQQWIETSDREYDRLVHDCRFARPPVLDCYGTTNKAEFFSVVSEALFECPTRLRHFHPQLYAIYSQFYRLDPANWPVMNR